MTEKETEIKALAGNVFGLRQAVANMGIMNSNKSYEERKIDFEEGAWIKFQLEIAEKKLKEATI